MKRNIMIGMALALSFFITLYITLSVTEILLYYFPLLPETPNGNGLFEPVYPWQFVAGQVAGALALLVLMALIWSVISNE